MVRITAWVLAPALITLPSLVTAQDTGGISLRFDLGQRLEVTHNADLDRDSEGLTKRSTTRLGLLLATATRQNSLVFGLNGGLQYLQAPSAEQDSGFDFQSPSATLRYTRLGPRSRFETGIAFQSQDITYLRPIEDLVDLEAEDPFADLDELDVEDLRGTGTRHALSVDTALRAGIGTPTEVGFELALQTVDYVNANAMLTDSFRYSAAGDIQLALASDLTLNSSLRWSAFEEENQEARETLRFSLGLSKQHVEDQITIGLNAVGSGDTTRFGLSAGWSTQLPRLEVALNLGAQANDGEIATTGSANLRYSLPDGLITARLQRSFTVGSDDSESLITAINTSYAQELNPLTGLSLGFNYISTEEATAGDGSDRAELRAAVTRTLTEDWSLSMGYRSTALRDADTDWVRSDSIYLDIGRSFEVRY